MLLSYQKNALIDACCGSRVLEISNKNAIHVHSIPVRYTIWIENNMR